jgi:hypothetical protein
LMPGVERLRGHETSIDLGRLMAAPSEPADA